MKKILIVLTVITIAVGAYAQNISRFAGGWNYVYAAKTKKCLPVSSRYLAAGYFLNNGCTIDGFTRRHTVMVLDCRDHETVQGYIWYAKSKIACQWIKTSLAKKSN
jgi:hypothetical protein